MLILKIAFRNIFRQRRRSAFTILTMVGGFVLFSLALSISEGTYATVIEKFTKSYTGHLQIHKKGYFDKPSLYKSLTDYDSLNEQLKKIPGAKSWTPRAYSAALASKDKKTAISRIIGISPEQESRTTSIKNKIKEGRYLKESSTISNDVIVGAGLAETLKLKLGDDIVLVGQGADGSISNDIFKVVGILKGDVYSMDRNYCYMDLKMAQKFLSLDNSFHELTIVLADYKKADETAILLNQNLVNANISELEVLPWPVVEKQFYNTMVFEKRGMRICLIVIVIIVAIGVLNTVLMTILERTTEYGVLRALGTRPIMLFWMILLESAGLAIISIIIGFILSFTINYWVSIHGIDYPTPIDIGGFSITTMYGLIYPGAFIVPAIVTFFTALIVSIFPAVRAMKIIPVEAMRMN
ncbi:MAG: ABC transporter permease [Bacteriovorax sp.]|nr:ABC transporter permease [Bacteriovorax sp.]